MTAFVLRHLFVTLTVGLCVALGSVAGAEPPTDPLNADPQAIEAWKDLRFGMFICWGPVSLKGTEIGWSRGRQVPVKEYDTLYKRWNPQQFDAREWATVVKDTGAKYVVFLTKHHDGFVLWDTEHTDYNVMNTPFGRDVTGELAEALRAQGIAFFPYYSTCDWYHPDFPATSPGGKTKRAEHNLERYTTYLEAQSKELITKYGPLLGIWYDVPQQFDRARGERVIRYVRSLQPNLLVNNRTGAPGDFDTPEQRLGRFNVKRPWESCITLGTQWAWKPGDKLKPHTDAIRMLVCCATGDGNLALNTNPMPDGRIEPRQVESFRKIGDWLQKYGESIYGTRGGPFVARDMNARKFGAARHRFQLPGGRWWGGSTHRGNIVYLHIMRWPDEEIVLPDIDRELTGHTVLTGGNAVITQDDEGIHISVPADRRDPLDTIVRLEFDRAVLGVDPVRTGPPPLVRGGRATASGAWPNPPLGPELAFDDDQSTRWGGAPHSTDGWLAVELPQPRTFSRIRISEAYDRIEKFELQVQQDGQWRTIHAGTTVGADFSATFAKVKAQHIRLKILQASNVPTIWEVQLLGEQTPDH